MKCKSKNEKGLSNTQSKCKLSLLHPEDQIREDGMGRNQFVFICFVIWALMHLQLQSRAQSVIIDDNFTNADKFNDLSRKLLWGDNTDITSGFILGEVEDCQGLTRKIHLL